MSSKDKIRDLTSQNTYRVNSILSKAVLFFLILCPIVVLVNVAGIMSYSAVEVAEICAVLCVLSLAPVIICPRLYSEDTSRYVILFCAEAIVCFIQMNSLVNLNMLYLLVPVASVMYLRKDIFVRATRLCFIALLIVEGLRFYTVMRNNNFSTENIYEQSFEAFIPLIIGYVIVMVTIYLVFVWFNNVISAAFDIEKDHVVESPVSAESLIQDEEDVVYNVKGLFLAINQTVQGLIRGKDKSLTVNVDYDLPSKLKGKPEQLQLALVNMLSDFLQFTEQGTVTLSVTYEKGITPRKGQNITVICRVHCSEDLTDKLQEGITMGFALAKNVISGMGGIVLDKSFGNAIRQTCYTVSYLQEVADEETLMAVKQKNRDDQQDRILDSRKKAQNSIFGREVKALVADDSKENQRLLKAILKKLGVTAVCVSSGQEAIERIKAKDCDFVLLDHMMPQKGGIQTAKEIRQTEDPYYELLPLMVMSSNVTEESRQIFSECGFTEIISKPIKEEELRLAISRIYLA